MPVKLDDISLRGLSTPFSDNAALSYGLGVSIRKMYLNGKKTSAAAVVCPRSAPRELWEKAVIAEAAASGAGFIYGLSRRPDSDKLKELGFCDTGVFDRYVKVLKWEYQENRYLPPSFLTRRLSGGHFFRISPGELFAKSNHQVEEPESLDGGFEDLWDQSGRMYSVAGDRSPKALKERFPLRPGGDNRVMAFSAAGRFTGYILYRIFKNTALVRDMYFETENVMAGCLSEFISNMRARGLGSISVYFFGTDLVRKKLREFGFFRSRRREKRIMIWSGNPYLLDLLLNPRNWYLTALDFDRDLI